jgi:hypothetical protein
MEDAEVVDGKFKEELFVSKIDVFEPFPILVIRLIAIIVEIHSNVNL